MSAELQLPESGAWHRKSAQQACELLTTCRAGLSSEEASRRHARHGPNVILAAEPVSRLAILLGQLALAWHGGAASWQTIAFTTLCFAQLAHVLAIRSESTSLFTQGFTSNGQLLAAVVGTVLAQLAVVYLGPLNAIFQTVPLTGAELGSCAGIAVLVFAVVELEKWWRRRFDGRPATAGERTRE